MGDEAVATGDEAIATGDGGIASGDLSVATGDEGVATGNTVENEDGPSSWFSAKPSVFAMVT